MTSVVEVIDHYQRSINKSLNDETRILHCLNKLYKLPILVQHLQETGIGRTVNSLRKYDGEVGVAAKALVTKWKNMVASEQSDEENVEHNEEEEEEKQPPHSTTEQQLEEDSDDHNMNENEIAPPEDSEDNSDHEMLYIEEPTQPEEKKPKSSSSSHHHSNSSHRQHSHSKSNSSKRHSSSKETNKSSHHVTSSSGNNSSSSSTKEHHSKDEKHRHERKEKDSSHHKDKNKDDDRNKDKEGKHSHHSKSSSSHSSNHHKSKDSSKKDTKDIEIEVESRQGSSSPEKENDKLRHEKSKKEKDRDKERSKNRDKDRSKDKKSSSSSKKKKQASDDETGDVQEEIDFSMGGSFADALALMDGKPSSSKSSSKKPVEKVKITKQPPSSTASSSKQKEKEREKTPSIKPINIFNLDEPPQLLVQKPKLEPLPDIIKDISEPIQLISPNYRPMPLNQTVMECVFQQNGRTLKRPMTDEEALGASISSKKTRTKVYSGVKSTKVGDIPTLYDMCIRLLQDYIDSLDYTGGVPYYILKPVLERCSPQQLEQLEFYNPYLTEESDELWEQHCKRRFKGKIREEYETWREMFLRCQHEQDIKLKSLTQNIKQNQEAASLPIRKTQLAYVDSAVKPPRNIISKQQKYGTDRIKIVSPAARVASLQSAGNVTKAGDVKMKIPQGVRDTAHAHVFQPMKPKKAPLMQKSLALMKGRFKR